MSGSVRQTSFLVMQEKDAVLRAIRAPVKDGLEAMQAEVRAFFHDDSRLLHDLSGYIVGIPGKKFRPTLLLLAAGACGQVTPRAIRAAAMIELVHTATLIHDDSIDQSLTRRGLPTINALWSDRISTILGDYLYTRAFNRLVEDEEWVSVRVLSRTAHRMTLGEMLQMEQKDDLGITETDYLRLISEKTASLISAACEMGAALGGEDPALRERFRVFGYELGMAYQITDDLFDYYGDAAALGKETACDLREGKITLPVIRALAGGSGEIHDLVADVVDKREIDREAWEVLIRYLKSSGAFEYCREQASACAERARAQLEGVVDGDHRDALALAVDFAIQRSY